MGTLFSDISRTPLSWAPLAWAPPSLASPGHPFFGPPLHRDPLSTPFPGTPCECTSCVGICWAPPFWAPPAEVPHRYPLSGQLFWASLPCSSTPCLGTNPWVSPAIPSPACPPHSGSVSHCPPLHPSSPPCPGRAGLGALLGRSFLGCLPLYSTIRASQKGTPSSEPSSCCFSQPQQQENSLISCSWGGTVTALWPLPRGGR